MNAIQANQDYQNYQLTCELFNRYYIMKSDTYSIEYIFIHTYIYYIYIRYTFIHAVFFCFFETIFYSPSPITKICSNFELYEHVFHRLQTIFCSTIEIMKMLSPRSEIWQIFPIHENFLSKCFHLCSCLVHLCTNKKIIPQGTHNLLLP